MGWNDVTPLKSDKLFQNLSDPRFYFLHSYYFSPHSPQLSLASSRYEIDFTSAVSERNIMGVQFHPEKSHHWGIRLLENFSEICILGTPTFTTPNQFSNYERTRRRPSIGRKQTLLHLLQSFHDSRCHHRYRDRDYLCRNL